MVDAAKLVRDARLAAGLTQSELARRMGTTQSAIARLERPASNPRLATLDDAIRATGNELRTAVHRREPGLDETQIRERLRMTPAERLATFVASSAGMRRLLESARPAGAER